MSQPAEARILTIVLNYRTAEMTLKATEAAVREMEALAGAMPLDVTVLVSTPCCVKVTASVSVALPPAGTDGMLQVRVCPATASVPSDATCVP